MAMYESSISSQRNIAIRIIEPNLSFIKRVIKERDEYFIRIRSSLLLCFYHQMRLNYEASNEVSEQALAFLKTKVFPTYTAKHIFYAQFIVGHLQLSNYELALKYAKLKYKIMSFDNAGGFESFQLFGLALIRSKKYDELPDLFHNLQKNKSRALLSEHKRQVWEIYKGYYALLVECQIISTSPTYKRRYRISKLINDIPHFAKDKSGIHIPVLILQFLFLLARKKYDAAIDRTDALSSYVHRYLRKDETLRSNCFIKMLIACTKAEFNRIRTLRYADRYIKTLQATPTSTSEQSIEIEIIPYEDLWEITLGLLK